MTVRVWDEKHAVEPSHHAERISGLALRPVGPWSLLATLERISSELSESEGGSELRLYAELSAKIDGAAQRLRDCGKSELADALLRADGALHRIVAVSAVRKAELDQLGRISRELPSLLFAGADRGSASAARGPSLARARVRPSHADALQLVGRTVVIVNEDPDVAEWQSDVVRGAGATVHLAHDGRDAFEVCRRIIPDVILADAFMSGLDGVAISRAIRRHSLLRDMGVLLVGARRGLLDRLAKLGAGADGYVIEKTDGASLLNRVSSAIEARVLLETELRAPGEVKGTLARIAPRTLLTTVARLRRDARIRVTQGDDVYVGEIRDGALSGVAMSRKDGSTTMGREGVRRYLALRDGKFVVDAPSPACHPAGTMRDLA